MPLDYFFVMCSRLARLEKKRKSIDKYTTEFCRVVIRTGLVKGNKKKVGRYVDGL